MTPPQTAEELVAVVLKESANIPADRCVRIHAHATRLATLLAERDALSGDMLAALKDAVGAFEYQVTLCHARDAAFLDKDIWARPMDYQEVVANMYAATAEPLTKARAIIKAAEKAPAEAMDPR